MLLKMLYVCTILHVLVHHYHPLHYLVVVGGLRTSFTRIAMLAGFFILLVGPPKPERLKDRGQTK